MNQPQAVGSGWFFCVHVDRSEIVVGDEDIGSQIVEHSALSDFGSEEISAVGTDLDRKLANLLGALDVEIL
jgi:hypothetical protein